jgi:hypothetical protein
VQLTAFEVVLKVPLVQLLSGRTFVPYGPYLCAATLIVLFTWRWIWLFEVEWTTTTTLSVRRLFGDGPALAILGGVALAALVGLLALLRAYRAIPVSRRTVAGPGSGATEGEGGETEEHRDGETQQ